MRIDDELAAARGRLAAAGGVGGAGGVGAGSALTIGVFDGVHRGHQRLVGEVIGAARELGCAAGALTFRNHPDSVFNPSFRPQYITSLAERVRLIEGLGADFVAPITFDAELAGVRADDFAGMLVESLGMRRLVVGPDFAMGYRREGDVAALSALGARMGFSVSVVDLLSEGSDPVSSTSVRGALARGDVAAAAAMLGRNFSLAGTVVSGERRGRTLGFPTANLEPPADAAVPADGIYACLAHVGGDVHMAATSIGTRPTFDGVGRTIEAFLLQFDNDLYNRELRLEFVQRLRDELRFDTVDELLRQMELDVARTREILQARAPLL